MLVTPRMAAAARRPFSIRTSLKPTASISRQAVCPIQLHCTIQGFSTYSRGRVTQIGPLLPHASFMKGVVASDLRFTLPENRHRSSFCTSHQKLPRLVIKSSNAHLYAGTGMRSLHPPHSDISRSLPYSTFSFPAYSKSAAFCWQQHRRRLPFALPKCLPSKTIASACAFASSAMQNGLAAPKKGENFNV